MKLSDIEEGRYYLVGSYRPQSREAEKVRVVEIAKLAKPGPYATTAKRRCRCVVIEDDGSDGEERILGGQEILKSWDEAQAELDAEAQAEEDRRRQQREARERIERQSAEIIEHLNRIDQRGDVDLALDIEEWAESYRFGVDYQGFVSVPAGLLLKILEQVPTTES